MDDIHDALNLSMEQTRYLLKRIVDGENRLIADLLVNEPLQLADILVCAATMLHYVERHHPEVIQKMFTKALPN